MKFNPAKCFTMTLASRKPTPNIYTFCGQQLKSVQSHDYLGVQIANTLNWTAQCNSVASKAQQTLGVIMRNLSKCSTHIKSTADTTLVRTILEYALASWDPHSLKHIKTLERIQRHAARFCTQNYSREPGTVTQLLKDLQWDHYMQHNTRCSRKHDCQFLQIRYSANIFGNSFFPTTIKEWNSLPTNIVSSKSLNSFQNNVIQHFNN